MIAVFNSKRLFVVASAAAILVSTSLVPAAHAVSTATAIIPVTATVLSACAVVAAPLVFGNYDPTAASALTANTNVLVTCTFGTPYNVGLNQGLGTGATITNRKMMWGANTLTYQLFQDAAFSSNWGQTIGTDTETGTGSSLPQSLTVYGRIPASQAAVAGLYLDTITVTVTY
jgi:spore coat protein U-like protein